VLTLNADGQLLSSGMEIASQIFLPPDISNIAISSDGVVRVSIGQDAGVVEVGQLELVQFSNPNMLTKEGRGLLTANNESGEPIFSGTGGQTNGRIMQGFLEMSNVELVDEMTSLVMAQRAYQLNARVIQTADQILETINNLRR
jgi:flagellar basal-body rod protein FlgG